MSRALLASLAALLLAGCPGPTLGEVTDQYAPRLAARHAELKQVVAGLPPAGSLKAPSPAAAPITPAPEYLRKDRKFTLDVLQVEHVEDPTLDLRLKEKLDLICSEVLLMPLRRAAPGGMSAEDRAHASYELYPRELERALDLRWVALVRTVEWTLPEAVSETEFTGGLTRLEVFLVDTQEKAVKASFPVEARPKTSVRYEYRKGEDDPKKRLVAFARSTMWEDAREKIAEGLSKHAGASVKLD